MVLAKGAWCDVAIGVDVQSSLVLVLRVSSLPPATSRTIKGRSPPAFYYKMFSKVALALALVLGANAQDKVHVGLLHSMTGTMNFSEITVVKVGPSSGLKSLIRVG